MFEGNPDRPSGAMNKENLCIQFAVVSNHKHIRARSIAGFWKKMSVSFDSSPLCKFNCSFLELKDEGQY